MIDDRDKLNMDSPYFDPEKSLGQILANNNVPQLVNKCNELQIDIRSYDQDIQSMVFENYSKFITSIDTVKKMKDDIEKVDEKLKTLEDSINKINDSALKIDDNLKVKRNEIQKLDTINRDLQRLRILCELPKVSKYDLLEYKKIVTPKTILSNVNFDDLFVQTIDHYSVCGRELLRFQNEPLIKPIYNDSIGNINDISNILWNLQNSSSLSESNLRKVTKKLVVVAKDEGLAMKNHLTLVKDRIKRKIKELFDSPDYSSENFYNTEAEETENYFRNCDYNIILKDFERFKLGLERDLFNDTEKINGSYIRLMDKFGESVIGDIKDEVTFLTDDLSKILDKIQAQPAILERVDAFVEEIYILIITKVSEKLTQKKVSNYEVNECLKRLHQSLVELLNLKQSRELKRSILDKFTENIELIIRGQVMNSFTDLKNRLIGLLKELKTKSLEFPDFDDENDLENIKREIYGLLSTFKNKFYVFLCNTLVELKTFISSTATFLKSHLMFMSLLQGQYAEFMRNVIKLFLTRSSKYSQEFLKQTNVQILQRSESSDHSQEYISLLTALNQVPESSAFLLLLIEIINVMQNKYLDKSFSALFDLFQETYSSIDPETRTNYQSLKQALEREEKENIKKDLKNDTWKCYHNYQEFYYEKIQRGLDSYMHQNYWLNAQEPKDVAPEVEQLSLLLKKMFNEMSLMFPDTKRSLLKKDSFLATKSFNMDMDKMLARKAHMFEKGEINRSTAILTIVKCLHKSILEKSRRKRLDKFGFQQLQIDTHFLTQLVFDMVAFEDESLILGYYYEIMDSIKERATDSTPLETPALKSISDAKRGRIQI